MDLLAGVSYPLRALALLNRTPRLWRFVVIPIIVNIVVAAALYLGVFVGLLQLLRGFLSNTQWGEALLLAVGALLAVLLAVGIGFVLVRFGVVLGAPWYGQLSEELEQMLLGKAASSPRLTAGEIAYDIGRALLFEAKKLSLFFAIWLPSLLLLLIPGLGGLLYLAVGVLLGAIISCLDFFDGPQERRRRGFRQKLETIRVMFPGSLSFGVVAAALVSIPLVNLLAIPLCVTAGNLFVIERGGLTTGRE